MELRYSYRIYPDNGQRTLLNRTFGCSRVVYNSALALKKDLYDKGGYTLSDTELNRRVVTENPNGWIKEVAQIPLQQSLRALITAYKSFFRKQNGFPKFKKKQSYQAIKFTRNGFKLKDKLIYLSKTGWIKIAFSRALPSVPSSVTVIKDSGNRYYASFVVKVDAKLNPSTLPKSRIGIDLGTTNLLTTSDGKVVSNPKFLRQLEAKLARRQRELSRKQRGSNNRYKARIRAARVHCKISDSRTNYLHKLSSQLIGENQAVYVEDIDTKALLEKKTKLYTSRYSKSISDSGWRVFLDMLEYKAKLYGREFKRVCSRYTSQICNICKYHIGKLSLDIRSFRCSGCGALHDRDVNAAKNILTVGLTGIVCGEHVRPDSSGKLVEAETATLRGVAVNIA